MSHKVEWIDSGREPQGAPDPRFPDGMEVDISGGAARACTVSLPYPARRCGMYAIACSVCGLTSVVSTAGRPDDPRSLKIACRSLGEPR